MSEKQRTQPYVSKIIVLIKHPVIGADVISHQLGLTPDLAKNVGEKRLTPIGREIGGVNQETVWSKSYSDSPNDFFNGVPDIVNTLMSKREFMVHLSSTGGKTTIILHLPGRLNIGSVVGWKILHSISEMRIDFGVEVFPDF